MTETFVVNADNMVTAICPECHHATDHDVTRFMEIDKSIKLKTRCRQCNHSFSFNLQRRKFFRKSVNLHGYCIVGGVQSRIPVRVVDLSQGGVKLKMYTYHHFKPGDTVLLEFQLDDRHGSWVCRDIFIRFIREMFLGVRFDSSEHYDKLGPYILFS